MTGKKNNSDGLLTSKGKVERAEGVIHLFHVNSNINMSVANRKYGKTWGAKNRENFSVQMNSNLEDF